MEKAVASLEARPARKDYKGTLEIKTGSTGSGNATFTTPTARG